MIEVLPADVLTLVNLVFFIILVRSGVTRACLVYIHLWGLSSLGVYMSMVAWIGSQSEAAVYRCL